MQRLAGARLPNVAPAPSVQERSFGESVAAPPATPPPLSRTGELRRHGQSSRRRVCHTSQPEAAQAETELRLLAGNERFAVAAACYERRGPDHGVAAARASRSDRCIPFPVAKPIVDRDACGNRSRRRPQTTAVRGCAVESARPPPRSTPGRRRSPHRRTGRSPALDAVAKAPRSPGCGRGPR